MKRMSKEDAMSPGEIVSHGRLSSQASFRRWVAGVAEWVRTCADHYAAAELYERLSKLSDAELHRRGLNRTTLAQTVFDDVGRKSRS
jgi:hypothetical protein